MAGIFAACIGGLVVSQISGSYVVINGPAAGLIVVILGAVEKLGGGAVGYHCALAAIALSGIILFILGKCKAGTLAYLAPATVVHGMLAAIGFIIIAKQIPLFLGVKSKFKEPLMIYSDIPNLLQHINPEIALIGLVGIIILIIYNTKWLKATILSKIPAPLLVVTTGIILGKVFHLDTAHTYTFSGQEFAIDPAKMLVQLPSNLKDSFTTPDWSKITSGAFVYSTIAIVLVQGIETLLSCKAVDKLDPYKRTSDLSKDLAAMGVGTAISGMIGGIPMIAEIVRSSANVANGAKTRWSNFFHGLFILVFVIAGSALIDMIPLSALAALLIMVGYRLASPEGFKHAYEIGVDQLFLYVITIVAVLATDLLVGVGVGIACKIVLEIINGAPIGPNLFVVNARTEQNGDDYKINLKGAALFSNFLSLKRELDKIPGGKKLVIDLSETKLVDHSTMDHLSQYNRDYSKSGGKFEIVGLASHKKLGHSPFSARKAS